MEAKQHYQSLDGLRGIAALTVALGHFSIITGIWGGALAGGGAQLGVMLFFMLSGFLMGRIYLQRPARRDAISDFIRHRVARVVPLYLFVVALSFAITMSFGNIYGVYPIDLSNISNHLLFLHGLWSLWTIPVEVQFYLLFAVFWLVASKLHQIAAAAILVAGIILSEMNYFGFQAQSLGFHIAYFMSGVLISLAHFRGWLMPSRLWDAAFVLVAPGLLLLMPIVSDRLFNFHPEAWHSWTYLAFFSALLAASVASPLAAHILGNPVGRFFGDISYSFYLFHVPIMLWVTHNVSGPPFVLLALFLTATTAAARVSYLLIERPSRDFLNGPRPSVLTPKSRGPLPSIQDGAS